MRRMAECAPFRQEKNAAAKALAQAELDAKRALGSVAGYHKSAQVSASKLDVHAGVAHEERLTHPTWARARLRLSALSRDCLILASERESCVGPALATTPAQLTCPYMCAHFRRRKSCVARRSRTALRR